MPALELARLQYAAQQPTYSLFGPGEGVGAGVCSWASWYALLLCALLPLCLQPRVRPLPTCLPPVPYSPADPLFPVPAALPGLSPPSLLGGAGTATPRQCQTEPSQPQLQLPAPAGFLGPSFASFAQQSPHYPAAAALFPAAGEGFLLPGGGWA